MHASCGCREHAMLRRLYCSYTAACSRSSWLAVFGACRCSSIEQQRCYRPNVVIQPERLQFMQWLSFSGSVGGGRLPPTQYVRADGVAPGRTARARQHCSCGAGSWGPRGLQGFQGVSCLSLASAGGGLVLVGLCSHMKLGAMHGGNQRVKYRFLAFKYLQALRCLGGLSQVSTVYSVSVLRQRRVCVCLRVFHYTLRDLRRLCTRASCASATWT